jgi:hypothetical protein
VTKSAALGEHTHISLLTDRRMMFQLWNFYILLFFEQVTAREAPAVVLHSTVTSALQLIVYFLFHTVFSYF